MTDRDLIARVCPGRAPTDFDPDLEAWTTWTQPVTVTPVDEHGKATGPPVTSTPWAPDPSVPK